MVNPSMSESAFSLLGLEPAYCVDPNHLEQIYFSLQEVLHPDLYSARPAQERALAAHKIALINDAYQTLKTPVGRARELLKDKMGRDPNEQGVLSPTGALLAQIMGYREEAEDAVNEDQFLHLMTQLTADIDHCDALFSQQDSPLHLLQETYVKMTYLIKLRQDVQILKEQKK